MLDSHLYDTKDPKYSELIETALNITFKMFDAAKLKKWEEVISLESSRHRVLALVKKRPISIQESSVIDNLKELILMNNKVIEISSIEKFDCFNRFSKNKNTQKACNAYYGA